MKVSNISLSFARLSVSQIFGLHPKGACLWGSSQVIPVCPRDLLQLFTMGACTVTPHTDDHIHVLFLAQGEALPCFPLVLCPPISHASLLAKHLHGDACWVPWLSCGTGDTSPTAGNSEQHLR